ncbi:MAG: hypothetical protein AB8E15_11395 [Bdellovibrionales bacterium]
MKVQFLLFILLMSSVSLLASPKTRVLVEATEDRWIHFPDGEKLHHGMEISHLLNHVLFEQGDFRVQIPRWKNPSIGEEEWYKREVKDRLSSDSINYWDDKVTRRGFNYSGAQLIIRPRVKSLVFASGKKSNRVVYGFTPENINPYNEGREDSKPNDFVASQFDEVEQCTTLDFFDGQMKPTGWGHRRSNFGTDADEGIEFEIFGFGIKFKKKSYEVKMQTEFQLYVPSMDMKKTYTYDFKAKGDDITVGISYAGVSLGYETQKRFTMREAINQGLPEILDSFMQDLPANIWSTNIKTVDSSYPMATAGSFDGIRVGDSFEAANGDRFRAYEVQSMVSFLMPYPNNRLRAFVGQELKYIPEDGSSPWPFLPGPGFGRGIAAKAQSFKAMKTISGKAFSPKKNEKIDSLIERELQLATSPELIEKNIGKCSQEKMGWFERFVVSIMSFYGHWRYDNVYDQEFEQSNKVNINRPKVAMISSGIYPREKRIDKLLDPTGFDFISWDKRPSDDLGVGTAAAKLFHRELKSDVTILPVKVLGSRGETHSSAIYSAMDWVSKRKDVDMVIVPFIPQIQSDAFEKGIEKMVAAGQIVIVPKGVEVAGAIQAEPGDYKYRTKGIRKAKLQLPPVGVGVVSAAAKILNTHYKGDKR